MKKGSLICPKCHQNGMDNFKFYEKRNQYNSINQLVGKYILYRNCKSYKKWVCWSACNKGKKSSYSNPPRRSRKKRKKMLLKSYLPANPPSVSDGSEVSDESICKNCTGGDCAEGVCICILVIIGLVLFLPFYLLIFLWIDIYNYNHHEKKKYQDVAGFEKNTITFKRFIYFICKDIWDEIDGLTVEDWNQNTLLICPNCKYKGESLLEFIENKEDNPNNETTIEILNGEQKNQNDIIVFNFAGNFTYPISFSKKAKFYEAENEFLRDNPDLKNKTLMYVSNGNAIDRNKTIEENGIQDRSMVIFSECGSVILN